MVFCSKVGCRLCERSGRARAAPPPVADNTPTHPTHPKTVPQGLGARLAGLKTLVLDEADQLLQMGFRQAIEAILKYLPAKAARQTLLFSATMPADVRQARRVARVYCCCACPAGLAACPKHPQPTKNNKNQR